MTDDSDSDSWSISSFGLVIEEGEEDLLNRKEEVLFQKCVDAGDKASSGALMMAFQSMGILKDDPRLKPLIKKLKSVKKDKPRGIFRSIHDINMDVQDFSKVVRECPLLISKLAEGNFVIPEFKEFCSDIVDIFEKCEGETSGTPADYIQQLARADPTKWGVSLCTIDGQRFSVGDTEERFSMQSVSKPFTYGLCMKDLGCDEVMNHIGHEPSGRAFDEILMDHNNKPHNPMVNSGAIMSAALLLYKVKPELSLSEKFEYVHKFFTNMAGGMYVGFQTATFLSEKESADRNNALAYLMREKGCFPKPKEGKVDIKDILDLYFQTCSLEVNCESLSIMAGTLANGGKCPISGECVLDSETVQHILSLMYSCGMYNYSGQFAFQVGLPSKSGVSGVVIVIVPDVVGFAMYSPNVDHIGNSVRGVKFAQELVKIYNFHTFQSVVGGYEKKNPRSRKYEDHSVQIVKLLQAACVGDVETLERAYAEGMDMNLKDYDNRTALHLASCEGHVGCVKFLIDVGKVDINVKDRWGRTPLDEASNASIINILKRHMAKLEQSKTQSLESYTSGRGSAENNIEISRPGAVLLDEITAKIEKFKVEERSV